MRKPQKLSHEHPRQSPESAVADPFARKRNCREKEKSLRIASQNYPGFPPGLQNRPLPLTLQLRPRRFFAGAVFASATFCLPAVGGRKPRGFSLAWRHPRRAAPKGNTILPFFPLTAPPKKAREQIVRATPQE